MDAGESPVLLTYLGPNRFYRIFFINGLVDEGVFLDSLKKLKKENPRIKFVLLLDKVYFHRSSRVLKCVARKNGGRNLFRIIWLPKYSPEINTIEYFNKHFKMFLKRYVAVSAEDVIDHACEYIAGYLDEDKVKSLVISFFYAEKCKYAINAYNEVREYCDIRVK